MAQRKGLHFPTNPPKVRIWETNHFFFSRSHSSKNHHYIITLKISGRTHISLNLQFIKKKLHTYSNENGMVFFSSFWQLSNVFHKYSSKSDVYWLNYTPSNTIWDSPSNLYLFKPNLTYPMGSVQFSVRRCVFRRLDLKKAGLAFFWCLINSVLCVFYKTLMTFTVSVFWGIITKVEKKKVP